MVLWCVCVCVCVCVGGGVVLVVIVWVVVVDVCARVSNGSLCAVELVAVVKIKRLLSVQGGEEENWENRKINV